MLGDFNINISPKAQNSSAKHFIDTLICNNAFPIITLPTRISNQSRTIIDNIITNDTQTILPGVIETDLSDHYPIFSVTVNYSPTKKNETYLYRRDKSNFDSKNFLEQLSTNLQLLNEEISEVTSQNFHSIFSNFVATVEKTIELNAPLKKLSRKQRKFEAKPWLSKELLILIKQKQNLYKSHFLNGNDTQKSHYRQFSNKLTKIRERAKKSYFKKQLLQSKKDPRKTWQLINSVLPTNKSKKAETPNRLIVDNREVTDKFMMSETFNQQFISIGKKLADNINNTPNSFYKFLPKRESTSIYFEPPRYNEVYNIIHSLKINKSTGHDNVDAYFIRISCDLITPYLTQLCDFSFEFGLFPECLKIAKVVPIFKNGSKNDINNYRSISLLSNFSKIMEKLIASRLMNFLEQRCVLHENQYGFRKKMSTTHAILDVVNQISSNINKKKLTGLVFLDLKKAFDTVSHEILLRKLAHYGIRGKVNDLFRSYLVGRSQYVFLDGHCSSPKIVQYGVPQGSNLGPILFTIYVNDIFYNFESAPVLYADDTCLITQAHTPEDLQLSMHKVVEKARHWMLANKLTINTNKSNALVISHVTNKPPALMEIICGDNTISTQTSVKYLGLTIDNKLSFKQHIKCIERKIACSVGVMGKLKYYFPKETLLQLYYALVYSQLTYALPVWGSTYKSNTQRITTFLNRAVTIISGAKKFDSLNPLYREMNILKFNQIYQLEVAKIMYRIFVKQEPHKLSKCFVKSSQAHSRSTRRTTSNDFTIPLFKTNKLQQSFLYQGSNIWNNIPKDIRSNPFPRFVKLLKQHLLDC